MAWLEPCAPTDASPHPDSRPHLSRHLQEKLGAEEIAAFQQASAEAQTPSAPAAAATALLEGEVALSFDQFVRVVINYIRRCVPERRRGVCLLPPAVLPRWLMLAWPLAAGLVLHGRAF